MAERSTVPSPAMSVRQLRNVLIALSDVLGGGGGELLRGRLAVPRTGGRDNGVIVSVSTRLDVWPQDRVDSLCAVCRRSRHCVVCIICAIIGMLPTPRPRAGKGYCVLKHGTQ